MRFYILGDGRPVQEHPTDKLTLVVEELRCFHPRIMAVNNCTEDDLMEQCRIVLQARKQGLPL